MRTKIYFLLCSVIFLSVARATPSFCAPAEGVFKGEITSITPKRVTLLTEEPVAVGDDIQVLRGDKIIATLKVAGKNGKTVIAEIIKTSGDIQFGDKLARVSPPPENNTVPQEKNETQPAPADNPVTKASPPEQPETAANSAAPLSVALEKPSVEAPAPKHDVLYETAASEANSVFLIGYSFFAPRSIKFSNRGYKMEYRKKFQDSDKLYDAVSYGEFTWNEQDIRLSANIFTFNLLYSLSSGVSKTPLGINNAYLTAGYSHYTSRLTGGAETVKKNASGYNLGFSFNLLKYLNIDYRLHFFSMDFPNGRMKNGEQATISFYHEF